MFGYTVELSLSYTLDCSLSSEGKQTGFEKICFFQLIYVLNSLRNDYLLLLGHLSIKKANLGAQGVNITNDSSTESLNMYTPTFEQFYISLKESIKCLNESTTR